MAICSGELGEALCGFLRAPSFRQLKSTSVTVSFECWSKPLLVLVRRAAHDHGSEPGVAPGVLIPGDHLQSSAEAQEACLSQFVYTLPAERNQSHQLIIFGSTEGKPGIVHLSPQLRPGDACSLSTLARNLNHDHLNQ